jgi:hypothetical protein
VRERFDVVEGADGDVSLRSRTSDLVLFVGRFSTPSVRELREQLEATPAVAGDLADDSDSSHVDKPERKPHAAGTATRAVSSVSGCVRVSVGMLVFKHMQGNVVDFIKDPANGTA